MNKLKSIILAARPKTLPASIVAVWAGCMIVWKYQNYADEKFAGAWPGVRLDWTLAFFTALSAMCIQIACNFFNDSIDCIRKADTARRQGPRRMTASGCMTPFAVKLWGCVFLGAACACALPLIMAQGWGVVAIGIPCMLAAYAYTGGPWPLAYHGLGELGVLVFFGLVAVCGTVFVQIGWDPGFSQHFLMIYGAAIVIGVQCGLLSCVLIEINNIRDRKEDASTGKRTLAVRLGDRRARGLAMAFLIAPYITLKQAAFFLPHFTWNICWLASVLLGGYLLLKVRKTPANKRMNALLGLASLHLILFLLALTVN